MSHHIMLNLSAAHDILVKMLLLKVASLSSVFIILQCPTVILSSSSDASFSSSAKPVPQNQTSPASDALISTNNNKKSVRNIRSPASQLQVNQTEPEKYVKKTHFLLIKSQVVEKGPKASILLLDDAETEFNLESTGLLQLPNEIHNALAAVQAFPGTHHHQTHNNNNNNKWATSRTYSSTTKKASTPLKIHHHDDDDLQLHTLAQHHPKANKPTTHSSTSRMVMVTKPSSAGMVVSTIANNKKTSKPSATTSTHFLEVKPKEPVIPQVTQQQEQYFTHQQPAAVNIIHTRLPKNKKNRPKTRVKMDPPTFHYTRAPASSTSTSIIISNHIKSSPSPAPFKTSPSRKFLEPPLMAQRFKPLGSHFERFFTHIEEHTTPAPGLEIMLQDSAAAAAAVKDITTDFVIHKNKNNNHDDSPIMDDVWRSIGNYKLHKIQASNMETIPHPFPAQTVLPSSEEYSKKVALFSNTDSTIQAPITPKPHLDRMMKPLHMMSTLNAGNFMPDYLELEIPNNEGLYLPSSPPSSQHETSRGMEVIHDFLDQTLDVDTLMSTSSPSSFAAIAFENDSDSRVPFRKGDRRTAAETSADLFLDLKVDLLDTDAKASEKSPSLSSDDDLKVIQPRDSREAYLTEQYVMPGPEPHAKEEDWEKSLNKVLKSKIDNLEDKQILVLVSGKKPVPLDSVARHFEDQAKKALNFLVQKAKMNHHHQDNVRVERATKKQQELVLPSGFSFQQQHMDSADEDSYSAGHRPKNVEMLKHWLRKIKSEEHLVPTIHNNSLPTTIKDSFNDLIKAPTYANNLSNPDDEKNEWSSV